LYLRTAIAKQPENIIKAEISHLRAGGQILDAARAQVVHTVNASTVTAYWLIPRGGDLRPLGQRG
jgi:hypothetical protein